MKIGILTAMEKEATSFVGVNACTETVGDFTVHKFNIGTNEVYLVVPPTVGEIGAAAGVQLLVCRYDVQAVLNFGIVGALTDEIRTEELVYVGDVVHYEMDTSPVDHVPVGYYTSFQTDSFTCDKQLLALAKASLDLPVVRCASGDKFVADPVVKTHLHVEFNAQICDMESAAIAITCRMNKIPCLMVKCVSDTLFGGTDEYWQNAQRATKRFYEIAQAVCGGFNG